MALSGTPTLDRAYMRAMAAEKTRHARWTNSFAASVDSFVGALPQRSQSLKYLSYQGVGASNTLLSRSWGFKYLVIKELGLEDDIHFGFGI